MDQAKRMNRINFQICCCKLCICNCKKRKFQYQFCQKILLVYKDNWLLILYLLDLNRYHKYLHLFFYKNRIYIGMVYNLHLLLCQRILDLDISNLNLGLLHLNLQHMDLVVRIHRSRFLKFCCKFCIYSCIICNFRYLPCQNNLLQDNCNCLLHLYELDLNNYHKYLYLIIYKIGIYNCRLDI